MYDQHSITINTNLCIYFQERVGRRCGGLRVLNSYWVAQDSSYKYYEVILVDPSHKVNWLFNLHCYWRQNLPFNSYNIYKEAMLLVINNLKKRPILDFIWWTFMSCTNLKGFAEQSPTSISDITIELTISINSTHTILYKFYNFQAIRRDPKINWIVNAVHKHREMRGLTSAGKSSRGLGKGHRYSQTKGGSRRAAWIRRNTLQLRRKR